MYNKGVMLLITTKAQFSYTYVNVLFISRGMFDVDGMYLTSLFDLRDVDIAAEI